MASASHIASFAPVLAADCQVLILGSMPGVASLAARQYYAHPRNLFWPLMAPLCAADPCLPYAERLSRLCNAGFGVWDVLATCERRGSLDSAIARESERANPIDELVIAHHSIVAIAFNGGKAAQGFRRHLWPRFSAALRERVALLTLPSTSPANASQSIARKRAAWLGLARYLDRSPACA